MKALNCAYVREHRVRRKRIFPCFLFYPAIILFVKRAFEIAVSPTTKEAATKEENIFPKKKKSNSEKRAGFLFLSS